jgi:hypothetical protein
VEKKLLFSVIIFTIAIVNINGQIASYDAMNLRKIPHVVAVGPRIKFNPKDSLQILPILLNYITPKPKNYTELQQALSSNPYIDIINSASLSNADGSSLEIKANAKSSILNAPITSAVDGLAKFLIKRAKQELLISFFSNLKDSNKNPEFAILFPNTKLLVDNFESWEYANIINTLREALNKDLKQLLGNIPNLNTLPDNKEYSKEVKDRVKAIKLFFSSDDGKLFCAALNIGNGFVTGQKIPDIIHSISGYNSLAGITSLTPDEKNIIRLLDILSYSVRSNEYGKNYISSADFTALLADNDTKTIFLGLLYQQLKNENITIAQVDVSTLLANGTKIEDFITTLISNADAITSAYNKLSEAKKKGETDLTPYWGVIFENANSFFQTTINLQAIDPSFKFPNDFQKALNLSTSTLEVANEISNKNYNAAIISTLNLISKNINTDGGKEFKTFFVKYGSFAANVVEAQNSEEVEQAIESVALPVGSASIKKKTYFNIALNAYLGGFWGNEYLADKATDKWAQISGVYAPVGVAFSWGLNNSGKNYGSISALINVIDIGAVASYRLQDPTTEKLPEVTLQNILAPGLGLVYGLPNFPLSIGYSYQFGPALRTITSEAATVSPQLNRRWQFFLAVDIPIFNFYTKSK